MSTVIVLLVVAIASWLAALFGWVGSLANLSGKTQFMAVLCSSFKFFDRENFTDRGLKWRTLFFVGQAGFFTSVFVLIALAPS